ncbi:hypothetical protein OIE68_21920 [Nocardia vinacea]|uniref:hypothetical protein n=1 Tax=Nocardia vinacea TaxID=96468 RepID=UPI002E123E3A|nr:hypothetical protein OIE68_21920 [Nocardia vinacea]
MACSSAFAEHTNTTRPDTTAWRPDTTARRPDTTEPRSIARLADGAHPFNATRSANTSAAQPRPRLANA